MSDLLRPFAPRRPISVADGLVARQGFDRFDLDDTPAGVEVEDGNARPFLAFVMHREPVTRERDGDDPRAFRDFESQRTRG